MATSNITLADDIVKLAANAATTSKRTASDRSRLDAVEGDLRVAQDFIGLGNLDRQAGGTLRRLSNQLQSLQAIKNDIDATQKGLVSVTQQRLIAQDNLRDMPASGPDIPALLEAENAVAVTPLDAFSEDDTEAYSLLYSQRRDLLLQITTMTSARINDIVKRQTLLEELQTQTSELKVLLDEKLLWVPSVPAIGLAWPEKVVRGGLSLLSGGVIGNLTTVFFQQLNRLWPVVFIFFVVIIATVLMRKRFWADIVDRAAKVGRVNSDSYWHTPAVIVSCVLVALPIPLVFFLLWILFETSNSPDLTVQSAASTAFYLIFFTLLFLSWRAWDRDKSLFASHYKLPNTIRSIVNRNLRWFVPIMGTLTAVIAFTQNSSDPNVYEGFSLAAFISAALALAFFGYKTLWKERKAVSDNLGRSGAFFKYRVLFRVIVIGLPLIAAGLAAAGYYDTANQLLSRLFLSGWLFLLTYVIFGLVSRTILVAQRRLGLQRAIERRDAAVKARQEKLDAEERGEQIAQPPPIDTSEIDVKTMSQQSMQLLNTLVVIGFAIAMWIIWSDLLPALSVFNDVQIGSYVGQALNDSGVMIDTRVPITLWNLIQGAVILVLTFIAARNLPSLLEIFVLSRAPIDAGTRYAITTILGYIIIAVGVVVGFDKLGLQWSQLRWIVTGLSVGIGFGLQKIIANFVSGLIILFERPVRIGDYVTIGEQSGIVSRIKIRATTLSDLDNREILIPNEALISERVTNWTLSNSVTRLTVSVGIAYGSDTEKARDIMLSVLKANNKILETPAPQVLFIGFGESSLDFDIRVFLRNFEDRWPVRHVIHTEINRALEAAGIAIPFPQTDLNIVSQDLPLSIVSEARKSASQARKAKKPKKPS